MVQAGDEQVRYVRTLFSNCHFPRARVAGLASQPTGNAMFQSPEKGAGDETEASGSVHDIFSQDMGVALPYPRYVCYPILCTQKEK